MKFLELFAGISGIGYGLTQAGMECVGYVEWDKYAHQAYEVLHDPERRLWSAYDIRDVSDGSIRELGERVEGGIRLIAAGFPCQTFSIAGKREGFADQTRGTLFFEVIRFASILRPDFLLLENVDGLRNHDGGRTLGIILNTLDELGYVGEWQVLNSAAYVPQNRERIFIVASLGEGSTRKIFPFGGENKNSIRIVGQLADGYREVNQVLHPDGISTCLKTMQGGCLEPKVLVAGQLECDSGGTGKVYDPEGIAPTQLAQHGNAVTKIIDHKPTQFSVDGEGIAYYLDTWYPKGISNTKWEKGRRMHVIQRQFSSERIAGWVENEDKIFAFQGDAKRSTVQESVIIKPEGKTDALTVGHTPKTLNGYRIRKLTPLECFRLQSYPDWWYVRLKLFRHPEYIEQVDMSRNDITEQVLAIIRDNGLKEGISDSQLYKMAGNGVTSVVAFEIGTRILASR